MISINTVNLFILLVRAVLSFLIFMAVWAIMKWGLHMDLNADLNVYILVFASSFVTSWISTDYYDQPIKWE